MPKSTHPIAYAYLIEGASVLIERVHYDTAYARNGNVGNPTEYFKWNWTIEMMPNSIEPGPHGHSDSRADAYERARAAVLGIPYVCDEVRKRYVNVRPWTVVKAEMQANYNGRYMGSTEAELAAALRARV